MNVVDRITARGALVLVVLSGCHGVLAGAAEPVTREAAMASLRSVAGDHPDAGRTLASLSEQATRPGAEAIRLYRAAQDAGDDGARQRIELLRQQGVSIPFTSNGLSSFPDTGEIVPMGRMNDERSPGYHCHFLRPGQMWCHSGLD